jgi:hypothetical protein
MVSVHATPAEDQAVVSPVAGQPTQFSNEMQLTGIAVRQLLFVLFQTNVRFVSRA